MNDYFKPISEILKKITLVVPTYAIKDKIPITVTYNYENDQILTNKCDHDSGCECPDIKFRRVVDVDVFYKYFVYVIDKGWCEHHKVSKSSRICNEKYETFEKYKKGFADIKVSCHVYIHDPYIPFCSSAMLDRCKLSEKNKFLIEFDKNKKNLISQHIFIAKVNKFINKGSCVIGNIKNAKLMNLDLLRSMIGNEKLLECFNKIYNQITNEFMRLYDYDLTFMLHKSEDEILKHLHEQLFLLFKEYIIRESDIEDFAFCEDKILLKNLDDFKKMEKLCIQFGWEIEEEFNFLVNTPEKYFIFGFGILNQYRIADDIIDSMRYNFNSIYYEIIKFYIKVWMLSDKYLAKKIFKAMKFIWKHNKTDHLNFAHFKLDYVSKL